MIIRNAKVSDAQQINSIISDYAGLDRMLFRSMANIYENIQTFIVAEAGGRVVGCVALAVMWSDLAEIKSLAVDRDMSGKGVGRMLVAKAAEQAESLGVSKIFALTLEPVFFEKVGFQRVDKKTLPMKVWSDCANCPKQDHCDEIAFMYECGKTDEQS